MYNDLFERLLLEINKGNKCAMVTYLDLKDRVSGIIENKIFMTSQDIKNQLYPFEDDLYKKLDISLRTGKPNFIKKGTSKAVLVEPYIPKPRLIIFGGGHVAKPVSEFASKVGFSIVVVDDRPSFANKARFPEADEIICESFEKSFSLLDLRKSDFVVIVTRGHRYDGIVLREVLKRELTYIGMMGSKRRVKAMLEELHKEGFSKEKLDALHSPIGLDIGGVTPDEIAISIVAQLIECKNKNPMNKSIEGYAFPEFDAEVIGHMAKKPDIPRALITILSSKGSTPRKEGAKMITYIDGKIVGSIGGGCSEAAIIAKARTMMDEKGFCIEHVDMTGEVAESEGMVCGGVMDVLIEVF